jgi:hypothetical protein
MSDVSSPIASSPLDAAAAEDEEDEDAGDECHPRRRNTATADATELATIFEKIVAKRGHVFCRYPDEQQHVGKARLFVDALPVEYDLLAGIHALQPNLSIGKVLTEKALATLVVKISTCKKMSDSLKADLKTCLLRRIRNMCRVVAQGMTKRPQPKWVAALPWMFVDPAKPEEVLAELPRAADELIYEWNKELQLAWRSKKPPGRAKPFFDLSMLVVVPSGADDSEAIVAKWPDGETHIITDLTWGQLRGLQVRALLRAAAVGARHGARRVQQRRRARAAAALLHQGLRVDGRRGATSLRAAASGARGLNR